MNKITEAFVKKLDEIEVKYDIDENEDGYDWLGIQQVGEHSNNIYMQFFIDDSLLNMQIKQFSLCKITEEKEGDMLKILNELNAEYRWVKFYIDMENKEVTASMDIDPNGEDIGQAGVDAAQLFIDIMNAAYPKIMMTLWQ